MAKHPASWWCSSVTGIAVTGIVAFIGGLPGAGAAEPAEGLSAILAPDAAVEKVAGGFGFVEGPVWQPGRGLLFSDIRASRILRFDPADGSVATACEETGRSNGLALDAEGHLLVCEMAGRRVARYEPDGTRTTLAERYHGKRLNSPNDLVVAGDGSIYFTDPPYGLEGGDADPAKELDFNGVFRIGADGSVRLLIDDLERPNGIGLAPDGSVLYVANSFPQRRIWMAYPVGADGGLGEGRILADITGEPVRGAPDGLTVDRLGNVYGTGSDGVWVFSPGGRLLGTIRFPERPANCGWGDEDLKALYVTARTGLYRIPTLIGGGPPIGDE